MREETENATTEEVIIPPVVTPTLQKVCWEVSKFIGKRKTEDGEVDDEKYLLVVKGLNGKKIKSIPTPTRTPVEIIKQKLRERGYDTSNLVL